MDTNSRRLLLTRLAALGLAAAPAAAATLAEDETVVVPVEALLQVAAFLEQAGADHREMQAALGRATAALERLRTVARASLVATSRTTGAGCGSPLFVGTPKKEGRPPKGGPGTNREETPHSRPKIEGSLKPLPVEWAPWGGQDQAADLTACRVC